MVVALLSKALIDLWGYEGWPKTPTRKDSLLVLSREQTENRYHWSLEQEFWVKQAEVWPGLGTSKTQMPHCFSLCLEMGDGVY